MRAASTAGAAVVVNPNADGRGWAGDAAEEPRRRGVDVFTLQSTLGHSSSATTGHYVAANPEDSSSLRLG